MKAIISLNILLVAVSAFKIENINLDNLKEGDVSLKDSQIQNALHEKHLEPRIVGGYEAVPHQFPYQVGLYLQKTIDDGEYVKKVFTWCGGSLISKNYIITAAHCFRGVEVAVAFLGAHTIKAQEANRKLIGLSMFDWKVHPEYDDVYSVNDIALARLPETVELNDYIQTIKLPRRSLTQNDIEGKIATASGWGLTSDGGSVADSLRFAKLKIISGDVCKIYYSVLFTRTNICVDGSAHKSVCSGDSGGPLVITEDDGSKTLVGLTSFARKEGCELGFPTVFTRISSYLDWIESETGIQIEY